MTQPDQRLLEADLTAAEYLIGEHKAKWGGLGGVDAGQVAWPEVVFWLAPARRPNTPERFYIRLDCKGYRSVSPTGSFWDPKSGAALPFEFRPKGRPGSRVAMVFRTDWEGGRAFYHPYDRVASQSHPDWRAQQPHLIWKPELTITDFLQEFHALLQVEDYLGV